MKNLSCKSCPLAALCLPVGLHNLVFYRCVNCKRVFVHSDTYPAYRRGMNYSISMAYRGVEIGALPSCKPDTLNILSCGRPTCDSALATKEAFLALQQHPDEEVPPSQYILHMRNNGVVFAERLAPPYTPIRRMYTTRSVDPHGDIPIETYLRVSVQKDRFHGVTYIEQGSNFETNSAEMLMLVETVGG